MASAVRPGGLVAGYRLDRLIGRGGMAVVYRAEHVHLRRTVALKFPVEKFAADPAFRERFIRESRVAASIEHPNLVTIFDAGEDDGLLFLAMQYVEGGDLKSVLRDEGRLAPARACDYLGQIAAALDVAHAHALVHRDVKPGNVLIEGEHCYVTDFGLSKLTDASRQYTLDGAFVGTVDYAAPEQVSGGTLDPRTDVYALGCLAFEALAGSVPFARDSAPATLYAHVMTPPPRASARWPELPRVVDEVLMRALAKEPADRHKTAGDLVRDLRQALDRGSRSSSSATTVTAATTGVWLPLPRPLHAADSAFVGREAELTRLRAGWEQACAGACVAVALAGEGGIGKTRLASELAREVHGSDTLALYGRCDERLAVPYQPFVEALRPLARALGVARVRAELGGLAAELRRLWPELAEFGEPLRADSESERFALFEAVSALLEAATREQPALLVLDDLHWAVEPTVLLLRHVLRSERSISALVLGTYRDTEIEQSRLLAELLSNPYRGAASQRLSVTGLDARAIAELLHAAGAPVRAQEVAELVRALEAHTGGNPFFIREIIAHMVESGEIEAVLARVRSSPREASFHAPASLREVIGQRVGRLSEPARRMLAAAAVAGPEFSFALLERVLGEEPDLLDALEEAVGAGLVRESGPDEFVFAHALVRQTIYESLGSARRMRLHRRLGEALEALGDPSEHAEALGYHFAQAAADGQAVKAADYALLAGRRAAERLGFEEAARHYERGLAASAHSRPPDAERRCELLLALGDARWQTADPELAGQAFLQAFELAEAQGDAVRLARAALGISGPQFFLQDRSQVEPLERALAALGDDDSALGAQVMARLAASFMPGTMARAREAVLMARRVGDKAALANVLSVVRRVDRGPDARDEPVEEALELARVAEEIGDVHARANAHEFLLSVKLELGDIDAVEHELTALRRLGEASPPRYVRGLLAVLGAREALLVGRLQESETLAHEALVLSGTSGDVDQVPVVAYVLQMLYVRAAQDRMTEMVEQLEGMARVAPPMPAWHTTLGYAYAAADRRAEAQAELAALAQASFAAIPRDSLWMGCMAQLAEVVAFVDDPARAEPLYKLLRPLAHRVLIQGPMLCFGSGSRSLGLLATTMGRYDEAQGHFEDALRMNAQIKSPLWLAETHYDFGRMLHKRGDRERAREQLERALATGEPLGLEAVTRRARALGRSLG